MRGVSSSCQIATGSWQTTEQILPSPVVWKAYIKYSNILQQKALVWWWMGSLCSFNNCRRTQKETHFGFQHGICERWNQLTVVNCSCPNPSSSTPGVLGDRTAAGKPEISSATAGFWLGDETGARRHRKGRGEERKASREVSGKQ